MPDPKMPPWTAQAKNAAGAIGRAVKALATGAPVLAPTHTVPPLPGQTAPAITGTALRAEICRECPLSTPRDAEVQRRRCAACGCFLTAKIPLATESCPKGKW
jgi:hypothetical protein